jgi:hypothetical protein
MWAAYALVQYPAGVFGDRFGERSVVFVSLAVAAAGAATLAAAPTFPLFVAVILVLGVGVGLYYNVGTALLARQFDDLGRAIGIHRVGGSPREPPAGRVDAGRRVRSGLVRIVLRAAGPAGVTDHSVSLPGGDEMPTPGFGGGRAAPAACSYDN